MYLEHYSFWGPCLAAPNPTANYNASQHNNYIYVTWSELELKDRYGRFWHDLSERWIRNKNLCIYSDFVLQGLVHNHSRYPLDMLMLILNSKHPN